MIKKTLYFYRIRDDIWPSDLEQAGIPFKNWARVEVYDYHTEDELYYFMVTERKLYGRILEMVYSKKEEEIRPFYFNNKPIFTLDVEIDTIIKSNSREPHPIDKRTGKEIDYCIVFCNLTHMNESLLYHEIYKQKRILEWN